MNVDRNGVKISICIIFVILIVVSTLIMIQDSVIKYNFIYIYNIITRAITPFLIGIIAANTRMFRRVRAGKGDILDKGIVMVVAVMLTYMGSVVANLNNAYPQASYVPVYIIGPFIAGLYLGFFGGLSVAALGVVFAIVFNLGEYTMLVATMVLMAGIAPTVVDKVFVSATVRVKAVGFMVVAFITLIFVSLLSVAIGKQVVLVPQSVQTMATLVLACGLFYLAITWLEAKHKASAELKERNNSLKLAMKIQADSLPSELPDSKYIGIYGMMAAASEVGGDFYDIFSPKEGLIAVLVADTSNKGLPASLFMMRAKATLRTISYERSSPGDILAIANRELVKDNSTEQFVTVWLGIIDTYTGMLWYSCAGHPAPLIKRDGECTRLEVDRRLMLGSMDGIKYPTRGIRLREGDLICAFTDGVTEQEGPAREFYGAERLMDAVRGYSGNPHEMNSFLRRSVTEFAGGVEQSDDLTLLTMYVSDPCPKGIEVGPDLSELSRVTDFVSSEAASMGMSDERIMKMEIVCEEIFVNICKHSVPRTGQEVFVHDDGGRVRVTFSDDGVMFNPLNHYRSEEGHDIDSVPIGGLGIHMVRKLSDELSYVHISDRNILTFWMTKE